MILWLKVFLLGVGILGPKVTCIPCQESLSVGVYVQYGQNKNLDLVQQCITNIAIGSSFLSHRASEFEASNEEVCYRRNPTVYLDIFLSVNVNIQTENKLKKPLMDLKGVRNFRSVTHTNEGLDAFPFLKQLRDTSDHPPDILFKIHTKSNREWLKYTMECMCGTPSHVVSIMREFIRLPSVGMIGSQVCIVVITTIFWATRTSCNGGMT